jgi:hypothetical protein
VALAIPLETVVRATLPAGRGRVGLVGFSPDGRACHAWAPVELAAARAVAPPVGADPGLFGGRPGWRYRYCPTYHPPPPGPAGPDQAAVRAARLARARATGRELVAWLRAMGGWAELVEG